MKKIVLPVPEIEKVEINGEVFEILKSGVDIMNRAAELDSQRAEIKKGVKTPENFERTRLWANGVVDFIDEILGIGAVNKIAKGRPVNGDMVVKWLELICTAIGEEAEEKADKKADAHIEEKYE